MPEIISWVEARQAVFSLDSPPVVVGSRLQDSDQGVHVQADLEQHKYQNQYLETSWRFSSDKRFSEIPKIECSDLTTGSWETAK